MGAPSERVSRAGEADDLIVDKRLANDRIGAGGDADDAQVDFVVKNPLLDAKRVFDAVVKLDLRKPPITGGRR
jgi:hypothetical protein